MAEAKTNPPKDVNQIIRYLTNTFNRVTYSLDKAVRDKNGPNKAYALQTEFAYLLNEVAQSQPSVTQKHIVNCNNFIDKVMQDLMGQ
jgi:hypothetical protein